MTASPQDLRRLLGEFRSLNPLGSVGAVTVFLALGENGGDLDVNELVLASELPLVQVCRFADGLAKGDTRSGRGQTPLVQQPASALGRTPRYALTDAGRALYARLFPTPPALVEAA